LDTNTSLSFEFPSLGGRQVTARFDGGDITSNSGVLLLEQADRKLGLVDAMAAQIIDTRQASKVVHPVATQLRQRVFGIGCGYEDANDFDYLCTDPALKVACGRAPKSDPDLASQPTLSRFENRVTSKDIYCMAEAIARRVVQQLPKKTKRVVLDIDAYDDPCHGQQQLNFYNAHYGNHCYLPLAVFLTASDGSQHLMGALLRPGNAGNAGVRSVIRRAVAIVRERFPRARIILRADGGFGNAKGLRVCDELGISYCLGLASNRRLATLSTHAQMQACCKYTFERRQWQDEGACRVFDRFDYKAGSWERKHNVVVKAEITQGELNPRYVVTDLYKKSPKRAYAFYCERGNAAENGIKEFKLDLAAGRTSCHRFLANQFRLLLHVAAAVLMNAIRQAATGTAFARAKAATIRLRLLKIGARVIETTRRIWLQMSSSFPNQRAWAAIHAALGP
jgi:hypothetical protein